MQIGNSSINLEGFKGLTESEVKELHKDWNKKKLKTLVDALKKGKYLKKDAKKSEEGGE